MSSGSQGMPMSSWAQNWQHDTYAPQNAHPPPRRALVACRRCRRLRSKCIHDNVTPPCQTCAAAGPAVAAQCEFAPRGRQCSDREYRRKRVDFAEPRPPEQTAAIVSTDQQLPIAIHAPKLVPPRRDPWDLLPSHEEVIEGCRILSLSCIQLSFIQKGLFLEALVNDSRSISVFLLLAMLSVSARFTPSLIKRYGANGKAGEHFLRCAAELVQDEMYEPTLERTQAFYLLGIAEWGKGDRNRSSIHMGIAVRMSGMLRLHREETYTLPDNATSDQVVQAEVARRTFWCIECQDNLYTGHNAPVSFSRGDISALLPCEESDFAFGRVCKDRAALAGTQAAENHPDLTSTPWRSIFATLIQAHDLWGQVVRRASHLELERKPWLEDSEYAKLTTTLRLWEQKLPDRHRWSVWNFRGYKGDRIHMAYLSIVCNTRLNNIVIRRIYLKEIMTRAFESSISIDKAPPDFWENVSYELFTNVQDLYEPIETFFSTMSPGDGFPAMLVYCVYICGSCASYLWKWPRLCPKLSSEAEKIVMRSLEVLTDLQHAWPQSQKWLSALQKVSMRHISKKSKPLRAMASQQRFLSAADGLIRTQDVTQAEDEEYGGEEDDDEEDEPSAPGPQQGDEMESLEILSSVAAMATQQQGAAGENYMYSGEDYMFSPSEDFSAILGDNFVPELHDFLQGDIHLGMMGA